MIFTQLNPGPCRTYLVASETTREAAIVDPVIDRVEEYMKQLEQDHWHLAYVIDTHTHADHISGGPVLCDHLQVPYVMHDLARQHCPSHRVKDGEQLRLSDIIITCQHTPGHTNDSLTLVIEDRLLTGDFLFIGEAGAGRTDLPTGDPGEHFDSLQKLKHYPDHFMIFPAHDYRGRTHSTLGQERQTNPRLRFTSRDDYVRWLSNLALPPVEWMTEVVKANQACTRDPHAVWIPTDLPACEVQGTMLLDIEGLPIKTITPEQARRRIEAGGEAVIVLDVRSYEEYVGELGHIRGSVLIPVQELLCRFNEVEPYRNQEIITVCSSGKRSYTAAGILMRAGFTRVASMDGGMIKWNMLGYPIVR